MNDKKEKSIINQLMEDNNIGEDMYDACKSYLSNFYTNPEDYDLSDFEEAYQGQYDSDEDFAQEIAEQIGAIDNNAQWPNNCIDWEYAARELMHDYFEADGYYFRNL